MARVVLVDDEAPVLSALQRALRPLAREGIRVESYTRPHDALRRLGEVPVDVLVSDYRMPEMDGLALLSAAMTLQPHAIRMILSASSDFDVVMQAVNKVGLYRYLSKPWDDAHWRVEITTAVQRASREREERELAAAMRHQRGELSAIDLEAMRLEALEPGITQVQWGPQGEVLMRPDPWPTSLSTKW